MLAYKKTEVSNDTTSGDSHNWQVPADRHDVRSLDGARLAHFTHCGKPPAKVNGRYDACARLHREWRETWARVAAESGVVA